MEAAAAFGNDNPLLRAPVPQNPMDFEYFEKLVNSEDEAKHQVGFELVTQLNGLGCKSEFLENRTKPKFTDLPIQQTFMAFYRHDILCYGGPERPYPTWFSHDSSNSVRVNENSLKRLGGGISQR